MYANEGLIKEIRTKRNILKHRQSIEGLLSNLFADMNHADSLQHSVRLSDKNALSISQLPKDQQEKAQKVLKQTYKDLTRAWRYGLSHYKFPFDDTLLKKITGLIEPEIYKKHCAEYRTMAVRPTNAIVTPPYPAKIPLEMDRFFSNLEDLANYSEENDTTVDISGWIHYQLARIHPFEEGNGRTARLMGNLHLIKNGYPPMVIKIGEKHHYHDLLKAADVGFKDRDCQHVHSREELSDGEKILYNYFAGKVNMALDKLF